MSRGDAAPLDMAWFETNLQNLRSVNVLGYVVKQLNLANDPEFLRSDKGPLDRLLSRLGLRRPSQKPSGPILRSRSWRTG